MDLRNLQVLVILFFMAAFGCTTLKKEKRSGSGNEKSAQPDSFLIKLLAQYPQYFDTLLKQNDRWRIQIVYSRIDRNRKNKPRFTHHQFNTAGQQYFYPASTVKLPAAALALQKLNKLNRRGLNKFSAMITEKETAAQTVVHNDPTTEDGRPAIAHYIKKIFLVSDNDAFNRLYEFLGQEYLNNTLHKMGWDRVQILHRLNVLLPEAENRHTNPIAFYDSAGKKTYQQPGIKSKLIYQTRINRSGTGYYKGDSLIMEPFDFSLKNRLPLPDLHAMLQCILFPRSVPKKQRFKLTGNDYRFLYTYMSMPPRGSRFPEYDSTYNDAYVKFLFYGAKDPVDSNIRIFNKVGDAYGFLTDAAYITDTKNGVEFLLSATIHCNSDGIYNDDKYDYETVGFPFLKNLGQAVYQYELTRPRRHKPDFSKLLH